MCGIAGVVNLTSRRSVPSSVLHRMADALFHRGPDEDGYLEQPGISLASRRLSIVGLADGRQPISNEDGSVSVVFNGELFDYPERRAQLEGRGHRFRTHCDTEVIPHLWEDHQEGMLEQLRGQFALALWDHAADGWSWPAIVLGFAPCTGPGKRWTVRSGCCSPRKSRVCWHRAWSRPASSRAALTTLSRFSACRRR